MIVFATNPTFHTLFITHIITLRLINIIITIVELFLTFFFILKLLIVGLKEALTTCALA
jgi:hypothetical protein